MEPCLGGPALAEIIGASQHGRPGPRDAQRSRPARRSSYARTPFPCHGRPREGRFLGQRVRRHRRCLLRCLHLRWLRVDRLPIGFSCEPRTRKKNERGAQDDCDVAATSALTRAIGADFGSVRHGDVLGNGVAEARRLRMTRKGQPGPLGIVPPWEQRGRVASPAAGPSSGSHASVGQRAGDQSRACRLEAHAPCVDFHPPKAYPHTGSNPRFSHALEPAHASPLLNRATGRVSVGPRE